MKPEKEKLHFEDVARTLRSAEFRRADDLSKLMKQLLSSRWIRQVVSPRLIDRASALLATHHQFGLLVFLAPDHVAQAIRAILLASATAATFVGRRSINRPSQGRFSVPCLRA